MPDNDTCGSSSIDPKRLVRILKRRTRIWPPYSRDNSEYEDAAAMARDEYAAPLWERYRQQVSDEGYAALEQVRNRLLQSAEADSRLAKAHEESLWPSFSALRIMDRLLTLHDQNTTGEELSAIYKQGRYDELGKEWNVNPKPAEVRHSGVYNGSDAGGVHLYLSARDAYRSGDLSEASVWIGKDETLIAVRTRIFREMGDVLAAEDEMRLRADVRQRHAELIGVLLEEYDIEGDVLPWSIGHYGISEGATGQGGGSDEGERQVSTGLSEEQIAELLTNAPAFHRYVRELRLNDSLTLEDAYRQSVGNVGGSRWKSFESFKSAHTRHWRNERR